MSQAADQKKPNAKAIGPPVIRTKNVILQRNGRFHEWSDACKARIISSKPRSVTLWDNPRSEPKPSPITEILAELKGESINPYEEHPSPANAVGTRGRGRQTAVSSSSSSSSSTAAAATQQETATVAVEEDPLKKEAAKMICPRSNRSVRKYSQTCGVIYRETCNPTLRCIVIGARCETSKMLSSCLKWLRAQYAVTSARTIYRRDFKPVK